MKVVTKFITNKWVLKIVAVLALLNVIGYVVMGHINALFYFSVFAILIYFFTKNMTIVLGVPLILVNLLAIRENMSLMGQEGMENNNTNTNNNTAKPKEEIKVDKAKAKKNRLDPKSGQGLQMQPLDDESSPTTTTADSSSSSSSEEQEGQAGFESGRRKNRNYNIDYATTVEDAYDELNNILGSDGIQRLTSDTQNLMKQQMQLAKAMQSMGPMMESLAPMVENLKGMMGDSQNGLGSVMDLAKKMAGGKSAA